jgi:hypothetical protein
MQKKARLLTLLFLMFSFIQCSYAAFPIRKAECGYVAAPAYTASSRPSPQSMAEGCHLSLWQKGKLLVAQKMMHPFRLQPQGRSNSNLSVLSFCMAMGADVVAVATMLAALFGISSFAVFALAYLCLAMALSGLVLGIVALAKRQKLKGLAIAGMVLGADFFGMFFLLLLIASVI